MIGTPVWLKMLQNQQKWKLTQNFLLQKLCWYNEFNSQGDQEGNWLKLENIGQHFQIWKEYIPKIHRLALIAFPGKIHLIFYFRFKCNAVGLGTSFLFQPVMIWNQKSNCPLKRSQKNCLVKDSPTGGKTLGSEPWTSWHTICNYVHLSANNNMITHLFHLTFYLAWPLFNVANKHYNSRYGNHNNFYRAGKGV